jgi:hypothetical protein
MSYLPPVNLRHVIYVKGVPMAAFDPDSVAQEDGEASLWFRNLEGNSFILEKMSPEVLRRAINNIRLSVLKADREERLYTTIDKVHSDE